MSITLSPEAPASGSSAAHLSRLVRHAANLLLLLPTVSLGTSPLLAQEMRAIPLGVYDKDGRFVEGLKPEQIRIKGVRATVRRVELDTGPRRIILLLDMSGSMGQEKRWDYATRLAKEIVSRLLPDDQVALHVFAEKHKALFPFASNFDSVSREIDTLPRPRSKAAMQSLGGWTILGDALVIDCHSEPALPALSKVEGSAAEGRSLPAAGRRRICFSRGRQLMRFLAASSSSE